MAGFALHVEGFLERHRVLAGIAGMTVGTGLSFRTQIVSIVIKVMVAPQAFNNRCMLLVGKLNERSLVNSQFFTIQLYHFVLRNNRRHE
ncbi:hypothetical protein K1V27_10595 [Syntrophobacteraceae bacterium DRH4]|nr:hypothetical protein [Desulfoferrobacter suflitae]MCK8602145.1 hypothetical protein [Desulfoferrobacter suflitae]